MSLYGQNNWDKFSFTVDWLSRKGILRLDFAEAETAWFQRVPKLIKGINWYLRYGKKNDESEM